MIMSPMPIIIYIMNADPMKTLSLMLLLYLTVLSHSHQFKCVFD